ncbi:hypothetical protein GGR50DRAFT_129701 [Xylaria sp. CBS 124048]|nr:hypothetical protein GGR50DRAFT_129701 [Xylaria sp. CBS 124048]
MAESLGRLLAEHCRTPTTPGSANSTESDRVRDPQAGEYKRPSSLSRMSSRLTLQETVFDSSPKRSDSPHVLIRNQDQVWYNPSLDQMVEAIQVQLMTRSLEPLPVGLNSYVLHLVEGFAKAKKTISKVEKANEELRELLYQKHKQWLERESQFQAEVKRLEVIMSKTSRDGLETVTLARTDSVLDRRTPKSIAILQMPGEDQSSEDDDSDCQSIFLTKNRVPWTETRADRAENDKKARLPMVLDTNNDFLISEKFRQLDKDQKALDKNQRELDALLKGRRASNKKHHTGFYSSPADVSTGPAPTHAATSEARVEAEYSTDARNAKYKRYPGALPATRATRATPARDSATYAEGSGRVSEATTNPSSRYQETHRAFSFKIGDDFNFGDNNAASTTNTSQEKDLHSELFYDATEDFDTPSDDSKSGHRNHRSRRHGQSPLPLIPETPERQVSERRRGLTGATAGSNGLPVDPSSSGRRRASSGKGKSKVHGHTPGQHPPKARRDPGSGSKGREGASSSRSNNSLIQSPLAVKGKSPEGRQTRQTRTGMDDALIAATIAFANAGKMKARK